MKVPIRVERSPLLRGLVWIALALLLGHLAAGWIELRVGHQRLPGTEAFVRLFDMDGEGNLPALYSTLLLLVCCVMLALAGRGAPSGAARLARGWSTLALVFALLTVDEAVSLHELFSVPLRHALGLGGLLYYAWVLPALLLTAGLAAWQLRFLNALEPATRRGLVLAGTLYVLGAAGVEMLGGWLTAADRVRTLAYVGQVALEESLEIVGLLVLLRTLLLHLERASVSAQVGFADAARPGRVGSARWPRDPAGGPRGRSAA